MTNAKGASKYDVLVVDPPWSYGSNTGRPNRTAEAHYKTIGCEGKEINRRTGAGIQSIIDSAPVLDWSKPKSHLYLWVTNPKLPFAFEIMKAWGFDYKTTLTWIKSRKDGGISGGGMGWFYRGATEHLLFGTRGGMGIPAELRQPNAFMAPTSGHSAKPDEFYDMIDAIYGEDAAKIDVFARRMRLGWTVWGDEVCPGPAYFHREGVPVRSYPDLRAKAGDA